MEIRWIRVRVRPMARPANPLGRPDLRLHDLRHSGVVLAAPDGCHAGRSDGLPGSLHPGGSDALSARRTRQGSGDRRDAVQARCRRTLVTLVERWLHPCHRVFGVAPQVAPSPHQCRSRAVATLPIRRFGNAQRRVRRHRGHGRSTVFNRAQDRGRRADRPRSVQPRQAEPPPITYGDVERHLAMLGGHHRRL